MPNGIKESKTLDNDSAQDFIAIHFDLEGYWAKDQINNLFIKFNKPYVMKTVTFNQKLPVL